VTAAIRRIRAVPGHPKFIGERAFPREKPLARSAHADRVRSIAFFFRPANRARRRATRRFEKRIEPDAKRVGHAHEGVHGHVPAALDLRDPLKRRPEKHAELLLRHPFFFAQLRDATADSSANSLGIDGSHAPTLPFAHPRINKVIALVSQEPTVFVDVHAFSEIMRLRILLIDDDEAMRRSVRRALDVEMDIADAPNGAAAIALLRRESFDAVVTDLEMPDGDGRSVVEWLERYQPALAKRVIIVTGGARDEKKRVWLDAWAGSVLRKPFSANELAHVIRDVARRK